METKALSTLQQELTVECIVEVKRVIRLFKTTCERAIFLTDRLCVLKAQRDIEDKVSVERLES